MAQSEAAEKLLIELLSEWNSRYQWIIDSKHTDDDDGKVCTFVTRWCSTNLIMPIADVEVKATFFVRVSEAACEAFTGQVTFTVEHEMFVHDAADLPRDNIDHLIEYHINFKRKLAGQCPVKRSRPGRQNAAHDQLASIHSKTKTAQLKITEIAVTQQLNKFFVDNRDKGANTMSTEKLAQLLTAKQFGFSESTCKMLERLLDTKTKGKVSEAEFSELADEVIKVMLERKGQRRSLEFDPETIFAEAQGKTTEQIESDLLIAFNKMDTSNKGIITPHQLITAMKSIEFKRPLTSYQIDFLVKQITRNNRIKTISFKSIKEGWFDLCHHTMTNKVMSDDELVLFLEKLLKPAKINSQWLNIHKVKKLLYSEPLLHISPVTAAVVLAVQADKGEKIPISGFYEYLAKRIHIFRDRAIGQLYSMPSAPILSVGMLPSADQKDIIEAIKTKFNQYAEEHGQISKGGLKNMLLSLQLQLSVDCTQILLATFGKDSRTMTLDQFLEDTFPVLMSFIRSESLKKKNKASCAGESKRDVLQQPQQQMPVAC
mmetsp:Transcript_25979/g.46162  ORF Transcript_25979/g.46162 Transcript_25979/m.46162 type:complete len:543 (-) Transcript_25979:172-1800(-)|eukprot:CAMPEP_0197523394 /NCGR_PEP_ID=MMETSP1318-20131121/8330_1 /TAXON_ID=552666 /ORGANISM="Partenskyella glossopodia, Strain RCC365" /LENGTH=542 /DNA_ID=CAMNT_0043076071 /DNA_START=252 /DNA_END=1880 /DNA_ORIENTATION=-